MIYRLDQVAPSLSPLAWVAPTATVIGNVVLSDHASVWFGAVIRGDNECISIGAMSNIQENAVLHTDPSFPLTIGEHCTIGHKAMLHGCTLENGVLIGMNATILNGAVIGKNSLIGAGALIPENTQIPEGSLVIGMPGRVKRSLTPDEIQGLTTSAHHYAQNAKRFQDGLTDITDIR